MNNDILASTLQANELTTETTNYEEQEQELMMVCVEELCKCDRLDSVTENNVTVTQVQVHLSDLCVFSIC